MYKISIPVMATHDKFEEYFTETLKELKRAKADRVFLCAGRCIASDEKKKKEIRLLKKYIPKLTAQGYEVGIWINSLGHGSRLLHETEELKKNKFTNMQGLKGLVPDDSFCPLDKNFEKLFCDWAGDLAATGAKLIMLDDDYRLAFRGGDIFCCCDLHMRELENRLGEKIDREGLCEKIFSGHANKYRRTWLELQRDTLMDFAKVLRRAVDRVDKSVRLGHCAVLSTWDLDGADSISLAKAFAGETKPFLRLIGASYWTALNLYSRIRMGGVIEYERLQQHWCRDEDIELMSECDSHPRPRYNVPAAYVEGLDTAMRASGGMDGALKYMLDYISSPLYEKGYIDRHIKNELLYAEIEKHFGDKAAQGIRIFQPMKTLADSDDPGDLNDRCIPASLRFAADLCMPVTYEKTDMPVILFGDAAGYIDNELLRNGAILDIAAAKILSDNGIDVGITGFKGEITPFYEMYEKENEKIRVTGVSIVEADLSPGAKVLSVFTTDKEYAGAFTYENADGERFLVYPFSTQENHEARGLFRCYCRQGQLIRAVKWLCGKDILAVCPGNPDLYTMVKSSEKSVAVGLWNFFEDAVLEPVVSLSKTYSRVEGINCTCSIEDNKVYLSDIPPFSFAGMELFD